MTGHNPTDRSKLGSKRHILVDKEGIPLHTTYTTQKRRRKTIQKETSCKKMWVVERTNSWHNRFRKLFTRYEKKEENYLGLVQLANSLIVYRRLILG